jgi:hypothetical protein
MKRITDAHELKRLTGISIEGPTTERPWLMPAPLFIAEVDDNGRLVSLSFLYSGGAGNTASISSGAVGYGCASASAGGVLAATGLLVVDPAISVLTETGHALDCLGMLDGVKLPREDGETDDAYRARLIPKLRGAP